MNFQDLVEKKLLREEKIGSDQVQAVIKKAVRNLNSAKILLKNDDPDGAFKLAYECMLLTGRALVFSFGFRPRAAGSHKIVVDFSKRVLGTDSKILTQKFDRMHRKRNYLIYGVELTMSKTEAKNSIKAAKQFLEKIREIIEK